MIIDAQRRATNQPTKQTNIFDMACVIFIYPSIIHACFFSFLFFNTQMHPIVTISYSFSLFLKSITYALLWVFFFSFCVLLADFANIVKYFCEVLSMVCRLLPVMCCMQLILVLALFDFIFFFTVTLLQCLAIFVFFFFRFLNCVKRKNKQT